MSEKIYDTVIIGGGPAGYTAALYACRAGLSVLLLEKLAPGGQMGTTDIIENYPGFPNGISGFELSMQMKEGAERFGAETLLAEVTKADLSGDIKRLKTASEEFRAKTVIIASGAAPRELGLPNERELRGKGVSYCATCDGMFYRGKTVAVVGGGNTAVSDAVYLSKLCEKVYIIHRRDRLRASKAYSAALEEAKNLEIIWDSELKEIITEDGRVSSLNLNNKKTGEQRNISASGVFIAVGYEPCTKLFRGQTELTESGYIAAGEDTKTSLPGVFAAGDVREKPLRQVVTAVSDGAVAAQMAEEYLNLKQN